MTKKEWHWMDKPWIGKVSGGNHHFNEGNQIINQGKTPKQMEASYYGAFIGFIGMVILIVGSLVWNLIKNW